MFKQQALQVNYLLQKNQIKFYMQLDKIYRYYQYIVHLSDMIESLMVQDKNIKQRFILILDWEKQFNPENIEKVPKKNVKLMFASLGQRKYDFTEIQEWIKSIIQLCNEILDYDYDIVEEFNLPNPKTLREAVSRIINQREIEEKGA